MNYRSVADMNEDVKAWASRLPRDVDLVVGIPRSGLLAASILSLHLNVPLTDLDGFLEDRLLAAGKRLGQVDTADPRRVLVVDDSVLTGSAMTEAREQLASADTQAEKLLFGAVYVSPQGRERVDTYADVIDAPRVFEWNLMHHPGVVPKSCFDLDGVLCRDPTREENDDGDRYREFISTVEPLVVPTEPIGRIVTARLEKFRPETEAWLTRHGIEYDELVMLDLPDKETRQRLGVHASYKAQEYAESEAVLFVESDHSQALEIARLTDRPVYSVEHNQMIRQGAVTVLRRKSQWHLRRFRDNPVLATRRAAAYLVGRLTQLTT